MNCELAETTIHGYFDGELDAVRSAEFEQHVEHCAQCQAALEGMGSLRMQLHHSDFYQRASPDLREKSSQADRARDKQDWSFTGDFLGKNGSFFRPSALWPRQQH